MSLPIKKRSPSKKKKTKKKISKNEPKKLPQTAFFDNFESIPPQLYPPPPSTPSTLLTNLEVITILFSQPDFHSLSRADSSKAAMSNILVSSEWKRCNLFQGSVKGWLESSSSWGASVEGGLGSKERQDMTDAFVPGLVEEIREIIGVGGRSDEVTVQLCNLMPWEEGLVHQILRGEGKNAADIVIIKNIIMKYRKKFKMYPGDDAEVEEIRRKSRKRSDDER